MSRLNNKADEFLLYLPVILMGGAMLGFGFTNYRNIWLKVLGSLITLLFFILAVLIAVVLGKSISEDKIKPTKTK